MTITELIEKLYNLKEKYGDLEISNLEGYRVTQVYYAEYNDLFNDYSEYPHKSIRVA